MLTVTGSCQAGYPYEIYLPNEHASGNYSIHL